MRTVAWTELNTIVYSISVYTLRSIENVSESRLQRDVLEQARAKCATAIRRRIVCR